MHQRVEALSSKRRNIHHSYHRQVEKGKILTGEKKRVGFFCSKFSFTFLHSFQSNQNENKNKNRPQTFQRMKISSMQVTECVTTLTSSLALSVFLFSSSPSNDRIETIVVLFIQ